jgi:hypothetical protein
MAAARFGREARVSGEIWRGKEARPRHGVVGDVSEEHASCVLSGRRRQGRG